MSCDNLGKQLEKFKDMRKRYFDEVSERYNKINSSKNDSEGKKHSDYEAIFTEMLKNNSKVERNIKSQANKLDKLNETLEAADTNNNKLQFLLQDSENLNLVSKEKLEIENNRAKNISKDYTIILSIVLVIFFMELGLLFL